MLSRLPPNRFVKREKGDAIHYIYADPLGCGCLYVGSQQAYGQYMEDQQQKHLAADTDLQVFARNALPTLRRRLLALQSLRSS